MNNTQWQSKQLNGDQVTVPADWRTDALGKLFKIVGGGTPASGEPAYWEGVIPWLGPKDMGHRKLLIEQGSRFLSDKGAKKLGKRVKQNAVIVSTRAPVGYVHIAANDLYTNQGCQSLHSEQFNSVYVAQWLRLNKWILDKNSAGSTFKELSASNLKKIQMWFPTLVEQTAIANILSDQEALVAHHNDLILLHEKRFAYLSDELLSGRLQLNVKPGGEVTASKNEDWKEVNLNGDNVMIPTNWSIATLPELCTLTNGSSFKPFEKEEHGIPIVRIQNLTDPVSEYHYYSGTKKGLVPLVSGDLLFPWSGTIGVYTYTLASGYLNQHIFKVTPVKIDPAYAKYFLMVSIDKFQRSGLTMPHITLAEIRKRKLVVCAEEQQKLIGQVLSDQEALIAEYKKMRDAEKKRFDWLSDALLSGTYRVKIEP